VEFLNALERDKQFFLIDGVGLTGQQSGTVNLRLRLTTYLRTPQGAERADEVPATQSETQTGTAAAGGSAR
jgi:hypothetical protein